MLTLGEIDSLERQLKSTVIAANKKKIVDVTLVEALDEGMIWPGPFDDLAPIAPTHNLDNLISRAPLVICSIASEIGFRFEGVGTVFWAKFGDALGLPITMAQRQRIADAFEVQAERYSLSRPSVSAFSRHFSIIAWPIANALLPIDLVGPVSRLMARAPAPPGVAAASAADNGGTTDSQSSKRAFLATSADRRTTASDRLSAPVDPNVVQAGSIISAALITGIRSDIPGQITAQVTQNVYASPRWRPGVSIVAASRAMAALPAGETMI